jgi:proteasome lid subunit RPN8/RPN11
MISITQEVLNNIFEHSKHDLPNEACGYLAGKNGLITSSYALVNIDQSPEHFSFDPEEQFAAVRKSRNEGLEILANYHSHPSTPARPSIEDIRLAYDPDIYYFIISLATGKPDVKAFRIINGSVEKIDIQIIV